MTAGRQTSATPTMRRPARQAQVIGLAAMLAIVFMAIAGFLAPTTMTWVPTDDAWGRNLIVPDERLLLLVPVVFFLGPVLVYLLAFVIMVRRLPVRSDFSRRLPIDPEHRTFWRSVILIGTLFGAVAAPVLGAYVGTLYPPILIGPPDPVSGFYANSSDVDGPLPATLLSVFAPIDLARQLIWQGLCVTLLALAVVVVVAVFRRSWPTPTRAKEAPANR